MLGPIARMLITRSTAHSFIAACRGGRLVVVNEGNAGRKLKRSNPIKSTGPLHRRVGDGSSSGLCGLNRAHHLRIPAQVLLVAFEGISRNKVAEEKDARPLFGGRGHDTCKLLERLIVLSAFHCHLAGTGGHFPFPSRPRDNRRN